MPHPYWVTPNKLLNFSVPTVLICERITRITEIIFGVDENACKALSSECVCKDPRKWWLLLLFHRNPWNVYFDCWQMTSKVRGLRQFVFWWGTGGIIFLEKLGSLIKVVLKWVNLADDPCFTSVLQSSVIFLNIWKGHLKFSLQFLLKNTMDVIGNLT